MRPSRAFAFQRFVPPALSRATPRRAFSTTVALDTILRIGPDTIGHIPLDARSGRVGARFWMGGLLGRALARAQGRSRRRERERTMCELVVVDSHGWRVVVSEEDAE